jgi:uncharacterized protein (DUF2235 family)
MKFPVSIALFACAAFCSTASSEDAADAPKIASKQAQKRLAIFLDGTWNEVDSNTNVWRMKALCAPAGNDGKLQIAYYEIGVNGIVGGSTGKGLDANIRQAYNWVVENYSEGDEIFIFGFSRGAYTARSLAGLIAKLGILKAGSPIGVGQLFSRYKREEEETLGKLLELQANGNLQNVTLEEKWMLKYSQSAKIKMVGVWDTVGSLGIPAFAIPGISRPTFGYLHTGLRIQIENGFHALAIDEHRKAFEPTLWDVRIPKDPSQTRAAPRPISSVEQRWFVGAHANVGGGYETDLLAQAPLRWIMKKASHFGLTFRTDVDIDGELLAAPINDSYGEFMKGAYARASKPFYRPIGRDPESRDDGTHANVNETIDKSVFDRWRADQAYRPRNLVDWAARKGVDPATIDASVEAARPNLKVPD